MGRRTNEILFDDLGKGLSTTTSPANSYMSAPCIMNNIDIERYGNKSVLRRRRRLAQGAIAGPEYTEKIYPYRAGFFTYGDEDYSYEKDYLYFHSGSPTIGGYDRVSSGDGSLGNTLYRPVVEYDYPTWYPDMASLNDKVFFNLCPGETDTIFNSDYVEYTGDDDGYWHFGSDAGEVVMDEITAVDNKNGFYEDIEDGATTVNSFFVEWSYSWGSSTPSTVRVYLYGDTGETNGNYWDLTTDYLGDAFTLGIHNKCLINLVDDTPDGTVGAGLTDNSVARYKVLFTDFTGTFGSESRIDIYNLKALSTKMGIYYVDTTVQVSDYELTKVTDSNIPDIIPSAIASYDSRLFLAYNRTVAWSTIGDGTDYTTDSSSIDIDIPEDDFIVKMVPFKKALIIFSQYGILKLTYTNNTAIPYRVDKITAANSIVGSIYRETIAPGELAGFDAGENSMSSGNYIYFLGTNGHVYVVNDYMAPRRIDMSLERISYPMEVPTLDTVIGATFDFKYGRYLLLIKADKLQSTSSAYADDVIGRINNLAWVYHTKAHGWTTYSFGYRSNCTMCIPAQVLYQGTLYTLSSFSEFGYINYFYDTIDSASEEDEFGYATYNPRAVYRSAFTHFDSPGRYKEILESSLSILPTTKQYNSGSVNASVDYLLYNTNMVNDRYSSAYHDYLGVTQYPDWREFEFSIEATSNRDITNQYATYVLRDRQTTKHRGDSIAFELSWTQNWYDIVSLSLAYKITGSVT